MIISYTHKLSLVKEGTCRILRHLQVTTEETTALMSERFTYDVYNDCCPAREVLGRLADKWVLLILDRLEHGPSRFNQLRRDIQGISQKMLTQSLRRLERDGLVYREVQHTVPITVEYSLTRLGQTLTETVTALAHWAERNMDAIVSAQAAYDEAQQE